MEKAIGGLDERAVGRTFVSISARAVPTREAVRVTVTGRNNYGLENN